MSAECSFERCDKPVLARGWCGAHYQRWRVTGTPAGRKRPRATCSVEDCGKPAEAHGLCVKHFSRQRRTGTTDAHRPVYERFDLFVPEARPGDCWEWLGPRNNKGYGKLGLLYAHRVACERAYGPAPSGSPFALHSCDNPPCVNPAHLSWGSQSTNIRDMWKRGRRNASL